LGRHNNKWSNGVGGGQVVGEEMWMGETRGGGCLLVILGNKMSDEKNENREGDGAMSFDDFWLMG
jgi:hypothetical protein